MDDFNEIEVTMAPAYMIMDLYFIFRSNGEEVEIDLKTNTVSHQLKFGELRFINDNYPFIAIDRFKIKKKTY